MSVALVVEGPATGEAIPVSQLGLRAKPGGMGTVRVGLPACIKLPAVTDSMWLP